MAGRAEPVLHAAPAPDLSLPPLMRARLAADPFAEACRAAGEGVEAGLILHAPGPDLEAALVLAPETPLIEAAGAVLVAGVAFADALGAVAPPEVAVHLDWPYGLRVNGAPVGTLRAAVHGEGVPDWLVIGLSVRIAQRPGDVGHADETTLHDEGCGEVSAPALLESWARNMLWWLHRFEGDGLAPIHAAWLAKGPEKGAAVEDGTFVGLDEHGGLLVDTGSGVAGRPLTDRLERL
ncbi:biotin/lipoate--protein ligase family protein [Pontivivens ytuae]|nr:biotin/lipoate--protein ligase family protein [Pontivivens ytuae]